MSIQERIDRIKARLRGYQDTAFDVTFADGTTQRMEDEELICMMVNHPDCGVVKATPRQTTGDSLWGGLVSAFVEEV